MSLPESQLVLDDLYFEFLQRFEELMDCVSNDEYSADQLTSHLREYVWELMARTLLLCHSAHESTQPDGLSANRMRT